MSVGHVEPNGRGKSGAIALDSAAKRAEVVKLRASLGCRSRTSQLQPSTELAEEYRQTQLARAEERYHRYRSLAMGERDDVTGEWTREPDWQAVAAIQRDGERMARMLGSDLERNMQIGIGVSREALAELFGGNGEVVDVADDEIDELPELPRGDEYPAPRGSLASRVGASRG